MTAEPPARVAAWRHAILAFAAARAVVLGAFATATLVADHLAASGVRRLHVDQGLMTWDATYYWSIAHHGYGGSPGDAVRFFPLYPLLGWLGGLPIGGHEALPLLVISNVAGLLSLVLLYRLVLDEFGPDLARRAVWCLALFPAAGIMAFGYSESLALLLTLAVAWWARRERWWAAAVAGLALGTTRPVAALVVLVVLGEAWRRRDALRARRAGWLGVGAAIVAPALGTVGYLWWTGVRMGDWLAPIDEQRKLRGALRDPVTRLAGAALDVVSSSRVDLFNLLFALTLIVALVVMIRRGVSWGWWSFAAANLIVAVSSEVITSVGRYGLVAFPFAVGIALAVRRRDVEVMWLALSAAAMACYVVLTFVGGQVP